ncbi:MAG TPA: alpha/beta hydrolase [Methylomirabilota bacterium]|jgi:acetyl esterase|nr:alpha/beta hydrolase [Methylomirabilota bacterium]
MPLDPQAKRIIDATNALGLPPVEQMTPAEARESMRTRTAALGPVEEVPRVEDHQVPVDGGHVTVRCYTPAGGGPFPALVFFHGGGWVIGDLYTHDGICRSLANAAACVVASVDYRLAPEHTYPVAAEDAFAATRWIAQHGSRLGVDSRRLAVGGDSAGGNLAAAVTLMARDRGGPSLALQALIYPVTQHGFDTRSYEEHADGYLLTRTGMRWFWDHYLRRPEDGRQPYASPLLAPALDGLPPALVITAEYDPLCDEGEAYAARLREAGVPVTLTRYPGMIHGFFRMINLVDKARAARDEVAAALRKTFA